MIDNKKSEEFPHCLDCGQIIFHNKGRCLYCGSERIEKKDIILKNIQKQRKDFKLIFV